MPLAAPAHPRADDKALRKTWGDDPYEANHARRLTVNEKPFALATASREVVP